MSASVSKPEYTATDAIGVLRLLEAIRILGMEKETRFYQHPLRSCTVWFRKCRKKKTTPFYPRSPYGVAKLYGYGSR